MGHHILMWAELAFFAIIMIYRVGLKRFVSANFYILSNVELR